MLINKESLVFDREYCPVCKSKKRSILLSIKHNSSGFSDFIQFEQFYGTGFYDSYNTGQLDEFLFEIAECKSCTFLYLTQVLNDSGMKLLYNEWLDKELLKPHYASIPYNRYEETLLRTVQKKNRKKREINLMDFGAGYGNFCSISTKLGIKTYAFDLSSDKNDHLNNMGVTVINNLDKYNGYFDFIYISQVLEHVSDPCQVLKSLRQSLKDKGCIYAATPNAKHLKKVLKEKGLSKPLFELISPHQHINGFTNKTLKLLGINAGLKSFSMFDFLSFINTSLNWVDFKFVIKRIIDSPDFDTALFFKKQ